MKKNKCQINSFWIAKKCWVSGQIQKVVASERNIFDGRDWKFYETSFKECVDKTFSEHTLFLEKLALPILKEKEILLCEKDFIARLDKSNFQWCMFRYPCIICSLTYFHIKRFVHFKLIISYLRSSWTTTILAFKSVRWLYKTFCSWKIKDYRGIFRTLQTSKMQFLAKIVTAKSH